MGPPFNGNCLAGRRTEQAIVSPREALATPGTLPVVSRRRSGHGRADSAVGWEPEDKVLGTTFAILSASTTKIAGIPAISQGIARDGPEVTTSGRLTSFRHSPTRGIPGNVGFRFYWWAALGSNQRHPD